MKLKFVKNLRNNLPFFTVFIKGNVIDVGFGTALKIIDFGHGHISGNINKLKGERNAFFGRPGEFTLGFALNLFGPPL